MPLDRERLRERRRRPAWTTRRAATWVLGLALGQVVAFGAGLVKAPNAPMWLYVSIGMPAGILLGAVLDMLGRGQAEALGAVCAGDGQASARLLEARRGAGFLGSMDVIGTAALEVAAGVPERALERLRKEAGTQGLARFPRACVEAHAELVSGGPGRAVERLLALGPPGALRMPEIERYRVWLVARAALDVRVEEAERIAARLGTPRDAEARAFMSWIRAWHDLPPEPSERARELRRGAELAKAHGKDRLAGWIDARAAALERTFAGAPPYRA